MGRKILLSIIVISISYNTIKAQINLRLNQYSSNIANFKDTTIEALQIASFILSTQEFKDSIERHQFRCTNLHTSRQGSCTGFLPGRRVYDSLSRYPDTTLNIIIKKLPVWERVFDPHDQIGKSSNGIFRVTTRSWYLKGTTKSWFASVKYAAHLAHEYGHIRGYYHVSGQQYGEDVAQTIGNLVGMIIRRRLKANEPIK